MAEPYARVRIERGLPLALSNRQSDQARQDKFPLLHKITHFSLC